MLDLCKHCVRALELGVTRAHLLPPTPGALIQELYTTDGIGTLISRDVYDGIRLAQVPHRDRRKLLPNFALVLCPTLPSVSPSLTSPSRSPTSRYLRSLAMNCWQASDIPSILDLIAPVSLPSSRFILVHL